MGEAVDSGSVLPPDPNIPIDKDKKPSLRPFGWVARPGDYARTLDDGPFGTSSLMRGAIGYVENGRFEDGLDFVLRGLEDRKIRIETVDPPLAAGTRRDEKGEFMIVPTGFFSNSHPANQIAELLHRNMSLILQRSKMRNNLGLREMVEMDLAYAQTLRLGLLQRSGEEKVKLEEEAGNIEVVARHKIGRLS